MNDDGELLRQFADENLQEAFAELVRRKIDLVYAAALRQTNGDAHLAQDVTQSVFLALAGRARSLQRHEVLTGWLYTTTRFVAAKAVRTQARWQRREREANTMSTYSGGNDQPAWVELRPVIDEAMHELPEKDRAVILRRFFEGQTLADIGTAIGLGENSARMRIERALMKLRGRLARRGIASTAAALGIALANQPAVATPVAVATAVTAGSLAGVAAGGRSSAWHLFFMSTKLKAAGAGAVILAAAGTYLVSQMNVKLGAASAVATRQAREIAALRDENRRLTAERDAPNGKPASSASTATPIPSAAPAWRVLADMQQQKLAKLDLTFLNGSGKLTPAFLDLFGLIESERVQLQRVLDDACDRLTELQRQNATITAAGRDKITIAVRSFAEAGGAVYDEVMKGFAQTLGPERNAAFVTLGGEQVERALGRFGLADWTYSIAIRENANGRTYSVEQGYRLSRDKGSSMLGFKTFEEMENGLGPVLRLLPADFTRLK